MLLIDALHINGGGGKTLLDYLISNLENKELDVIYLLDEKIKNHNYRIKKSNRIIYLKSNFNNRLMFYLKNKIEFKTIFCFGNIPPYIRTKARVYTYFHQLLYINVEKSFSLKERFIFFLKTQILNLMKHNTDKWFVQSAIVKDFFIKKYSVDSDKIKILPFFPKKNIYNVDNVEKGSHVFLYVSNATPHKNHQILIDAFESFYLKYRIGELILTVSENYPQVFDLIKTKKEQGIPINNYGFVDNKKLNELYSKSEYLIFPSLSESFGLGIIEALEFDCKILGADLPYTYAICEPSAIFNPLDLNSVMGAFESAVLHKLPNSKAKVRDEIDTLINLLIS